MDWADRGVVSKLITGTAVVGLVLFLFFWFIIYLIYLPLNWLWVHRLRDGVKEVLKEDSLKQGYDKNKVVDYDR